MRNKIRKARPELFDLLNGRNRSAFDAKIKGQPFDDRTYTDMVIEQIESSSELSYHENGFTLLHLAVQEKEIPFVLALLNNGLDVNAKTEHGMTPLQKAASGYKEGEDPSLISLLIENGAEINIELAGMSLADFFKFKGLDIKSL